MRNKCKEIIAVKDTTYAGEKGKPEEFRLCRDSNPGLCNTRIVL